MTTLFNEGTICSVCNHKSEFKVIGSTNAFGSQDLDTRPPEMERSTIIYGIQRCPNCGYCATDISDENAKAKEIIESEGYKIALSNNHLSTVANSYLCSAILKMKINNLKEAIWDTIRAAWICDDNNDNVGAIYCRTQALKITEALELTGESLAPLDGSSIAMKVDLLRRSLNFLDAIELIEKELPSIANETIVDILNFQKKLCKAHDSKCHTVEEAFDVSDEQ